MRTLPLLRFLPIALAALASAHCMNAATPSKPLECRMEAVHPLVATTRRAAPKTLLSNGSLARTVAGVRRPG